MTRESKSPVPSSITSTGTLPSGLYSATRVSGSQGESSIRSHSILFSASTIRTLRAYGLVSEAISFMRHRSKTCSNPSEHGFERDANYSIASTSLRVHAAFSADPSIPRARGSRVPACAKIRVSSATMPHTPLALSALTALSPLDGRYREKVSALAEHFSEYGLIRNRIKVELAWLCALADEPP